MFFGTKDLIQWQFETLISFQSLNLQYFPDWSAHSNRFTGNFLQPSDFANFYYVVSSFFSLHYKLQKSITKTYLYNFDPLKPHFYIVKLGFTGVYIIFLISTQNIDCGYSLEPPRGGGSNEYLQSMFWAEIWNIFEFFIWKFASFGL